MKLLFCPACTDVFKLLSAYRSCECGESGGQYVDNVNAEIWGQAIPLGIANESFRRALNNIPARGVGRRFDAFVVPKQVPTIKRR